MIQDNLSISRSRSKFMLESEKWFYVWDLFKTVNDESLSKFGEESKAI